MFDKIMKNRKLYLIEDLVQNIGSDYNDVFQLYFYYHLFSPNNDSTILDHENLLRNIVKTLLNELFWLDQDDNKSVLNEHIKENSIKFDYCIIMYILLKLNIWLSNI